MNTIILKFGGSSVADNIKLNIVAEKVIEFKEKAERLIVVVSAQGKTTDILIKEAEELSNIPDEREVDMLLSTGEQITASKLCILLNNKGYKVVSLTGWQVGIKTSNVHKKAKIEQIFTERIEQELKENKIVIVAGFQGINEKGDITTLGRGGSDTTAVALGAALNADECYIFSDVDGIYSADPNIIKCAKRLDRISFEEMRETADSGAKVLHNRCIQIGEKFDCNIIAKSTFTNNGETKICKKIENTEVKSIIKNENLLEIKMIKKQSNNYSEKEIYKKLLNENIIIENYKQINHEEKISFRIQKQEITKVENILKCNFENYNLIVEPIIKLSIVGYGITQDNKVLEQIIEILNKNEVELLEVNLNQAKIEIIVKSLKNSILEEIHKKIIK